MTNARALLELHSAAAVFVRRRAAPSASARERLRLAVIATMRDRGADCPADLITTPQEALQALRALLERCRELRVSWTDIVAIVNREEEAP